MCSKLVQGFKVLPLRYTSESTCCHEIFMKEHSVRAHDEEKPAGRTLFVLNIPPTVNEDNIKTAFSSAGKIAKVIFQKSVKSDEDNLNTGFKLGFVVFHQREGLLKALKLNTLNAVSNDKKPLITGIEKWIQEYNSSIKDPKELQEEIDMFMSSYERMEEMQKSKSKEEVDDEGWTVVSKKSRTPALSRKDSVQIKINDKIQKGAKKKELKNFYTFQIREGKMKQLATLRKNYEEAKKKVSLMKSTRRFKPY